MAKNKTDYKKVFTTVFVVVLAVVFVGAYSSGNFFSSNRQQLLGTVNGSEIYTYSDDFQRIYGSLRERMREEKSEFKKADEARIRQQAFQQTALSRLLFDYMEEQGIHAADATVKKSIKGQFVGSNNKFNELAYRSFLKRAPHERKVMAEQQYRRSIEKSIFYSDLNLMNFQSEPSTIERLAYKYIPASHLEIDNYLFLSAIRKKVIIAQKFLDDYSSLITEEMLRDFYTQHKAKYGWDSFANNRFDIQIRFENQKEQMLKEKLKTPFVEKLNEALIAGKFRQNFRQAAASLGMNIRITPFFSYNDKEITDQHGNPVYLNLKSAVFLSKGEISQVVTDDNDDSVAVFMVIGEQVPSGDTFDVSDEEYEQIKNQLRQQKAYTLTVYFRNWLYNNANIQYVKAGE
ncbi:MAG TPA: SurA N-terminal domain-containing protein [Spirochaetota bacterium]|nr:SurA N-terminal domain-containing protein [Spirochaetota bacterium]